VANLEGNVTALVYNLTGQRCTFAVAAAVGNYAPCDYIVNMSANYKTFQLPLKKKGK